MAQHLDGAPGPRAVKRFLERAIESGRASWALLALGVLLRLSTLFKGAHLPVEGGFDYVQHWAYIQYIADHWSLPPKTLNNTTTHPPFYYVLSAVLVALKATPRVVSFFSIVCGSAKLVVLHRALAGRTTALARTLAVSLAALLPCALHLDCMVHAEPLDGLLCTLAMVLGARLLDAPAARGALRKGALLGAVLGLAMITKVSSLMVVVALLGAAPVAAWRAAKALAPRARALAPFAIAGALAVAISGFFYVDNWRHYGQPVIVAFDLGAHARVKQFDGIPLWKRREPVYLFGWSNAIYKSPFYPAAQDSKETSRFFPVLVATTFADYYNCDFCAAPLQRDPKAVVNGRAAPRPLCFPLASASVLGGTVVALGLVASFVALGVWGVRKREIGALAVLAAGALGVVGMIQFAFKYPIDTGGVVKGLYVQFAAAPLFVAWGVGVDWLWRRRATSRLAAAGALASFAALLPIVAYDLYCRVLAPLADALHGA